MKAIGYWLMCIAAFRLAFKLCEVGVGLMIDFVVDNSSGVNGVLDDRISSFDLACSLMLMMDICIVACSF